MIGDDGQRARGRSSDRHLDKSRDRKVRLRQAGHGGRCSGARPGLHLPENQLPHPARLSCGARRSEQSQERHPSLGVLGVIRTVGVLGVRAQGLAQVVQRLLDTV